MAIISDEIRFLPLQDLFLFITVLALLKKYAIGSVTGSSLKEEKTKSANITACCQLNPNDCCKNFRDR